MYFLVKTENYFYDGHGCPDEGGVKLEVSSDKMYDQLKDNTYYIENYDSESGYIEEGLEDEEDFMASDGYNCQVERLVVKRISEEESIKYKKIISDYENLSNIFNS